MRKNQTKLYSQGFTLIELLVVISIISLLASIVASSVNTARVKARDAKRVADLKQIRTALELYNSDNGHYPITWCSTGNTWTAFDTANFYAGNGICSTTGGAVVNANITAALSPYMKGAADPKRSAESDSGYLYYSDDGVKFKLMAYESPENMNNFDKSVIDAFRCGTPTAAGGCTNNGSAAYGWPPVKAVSFFTPGGEFY